MVQAQTTSFLYPPFLGTVWESSIYDHSLPGWVTLPDGSGYYGFDGFITAYNGVTSSGGCSVGSQPCSYTNINPIPPPGVIRTGFNGVLSYEGHDGIDLAMTYAPVLAAADGTVSRARWKDPQNHASNFGLYIRLYHATQNLSTLYAHLGSTAVREGDSVTHSQIIGLSGNSGGSGSPHLHFGVYNGNNETQAIDPYGWLPYDGNIAHPSDPTTNGSLWVINPAIQTGSILPEGTPQTHTFAPSNNDVIVDDPQAIKRECWLNAPTVAGDQYQGTGFLYTVPVINVVPDPLPRCSVKWNFPSTLSTGNYEVYVRVPLSNAGYANSEGAQYTIRHNNIESGAIIDQNVFPNGVNDGRVLVGRYCFAANGLEYVLLSNISLDSPTATGKSIAADAIIFRPTGTSENCSPQVAPTVTRTPTLFPTLPANTTIISASMNETSGSTVVDTSGRNHNGTASNTTIIAGQSGNARRFPSSGSGKITFPAHTDYYQGVRTNDTFTVDFWFRRSAVSNGTETLANLLGNPTPSNPDMNRWAGWDIRLSFNTSNNASLFFRVYQGDSDWTTPKDISISISNYANQWVHVKAIKGSPNRLTLCTSINGGAWQVSELTTLHGGISVFYRENTTLDLGVDYLSTSAGSWHGDIDEFSYKNYADYSGACQPLQPTPTFTPTSVFQNRNYLPIILKPIEPTATPTSSGPDGIVPPTEEPPPDGYPGLSTPTPTFTKTVTPTRTATFTKTPKPSRTPRP